MQIKKHSSRFSLMAAAAVGVAGIAAVAFLFSTSSPAGAPKAKKHKTSDTTKKQLVSPATPSHSIDEPSSLWVIVNKTRPLPSDYAPDNLAPPNVTLNASKSTEENSLRADIAPSLAALFRDAKQAGYDYMLASGYRSHTLQNSYYTNYVASSGQAEADRYSARPGTSEHQTGLALDISTVDRVNYLEQAFGEDASGKWLAAHAHEYGFIIRYLPGKEPITGYMYEPWHIRYVGEYLAKKLFDKQQTMEEYFGLYKPTS
jgi:zinc D-Ala-D-Ala carboxypeptidase